MSIILATINIKKNLYGATSDQLAAIAPNVSMGLLHAYIDSKNIPVEMIDSEVEGYDIDDLIIQLEKKKPSLLVIIATGANPSASTMSMIGVIQFFNALRKRGQPDYKTCIYGGHPTVLPKRSLTETGADYVLIGEGYETLVKLHDRLQRKKELNTVPGIGYVEDGVYHQNKPHELIDLKELSMVHWDKMKPSNYRAHNWHCFSDVNNRSPYAIIWTNMGCPYPCEFCCINNLFGKRTFRFRPIEAVVAEIDLLVNDYGVRNIKILDELFIIKHPRIDKFCDLLEERNYDLNLWCFARTDSVTPRILKRLKKIGLNWVAYGFETVNDHLLSSTNKSLNNRQTTASYEDVIKWTRDAGIHICADVIAGLWEDSRETIAKTFAFLKNHQFEWINIYPCFAFPGTPLYDDYIRKGIIEEPKTWNIYSLYGYDCEPLPTKYLSNAEVLKLRDSIFQDYYHDPLILSMIEKKFGLDTKDHVERMTFMKLKRRLLND